MSHRRRDRENNANKTPLGRRDSSSKSSSSLLKSSSSSLKSSSSSKSSPPPLKYSSSSKSSSLPKSSTSSKSSSPHKSSSSSSKSSPPPLKSSSSSKSTSSKSSSSKSSSLPKSSSSSKSSSSKSSSSRHSSSRHSSSRHSSSRHSSYRRTGHSSDDTECANHSSNSSTAVANINSSPKLDISKSREDGNEPKDGERKRKRKSRWMDEKPVFPGLPTIPPSNPSDKEDAYMIQLQIEDISRKLRTGYLGIPLNPGDRSPSPEPIYSTDGKRLNTRENRMRKKLEDDRHTLILRLKELNPLYIPPTDYKPPVLKIVQEVPIPQEEHPEINFVGLLIGPRGNTLKSLVKDTGAKIIIRGKGSIREGKISGHPLPGEDQPLHAYVTSNNLQSVKKACEKIREIIRKGIEMPEGQNDLRKNQLRELAILNGTLRECEGTKCSNCGSTAHRTWNCPDKPNYTTSVVCTVCGGGGHLPIDCKLAPPGFIHFAPLKTNYDDKTKIDQEYLSLMAEIGEGGESAARTLGGPHFSSGGLFDQSSIPMALMAGPGMAQPPPPGMFWGGWAPPPVPPSFNQPPPPGCE